MPDEQTALPTKKIRVNRTFPQDLQSHFVNDVVIQHQPDHFIISFFEMWFPPVVGETEEEKQQVLDAIDSIESKCVARLVVTPAKMQEFVRAMAENLESYEHKMNLLSELDLDE